MSAELVHCRTMVQLASSALAQAASPRALALSEQKSYQTAEVKKLVDQSTFSGSPTPWSAGGQVPDPKSANVLVRKREQ